MSNINYQPGLTQTINANLLKILNRWLIINFVLLAVKSTAGPMASSVDALISASRVFASEEMFDADFTIPRQPFNEQVSQL